MLVEHFGHVVSEETLLERTRPDSRNDQTLRVNVSRLRRRIAPLGLVITCVRGHGYLMQQEIGRLLGLSLADVDRASAMISG